MSEDEVQSESAKSNTSYQGLFVLGITFTGAGAALSVTNPGMLGLLALGIVFMVIGLANRNKWKST